MADAFPYVMTPDEIAVGFVSGTEGSLPPDAGLSARQALEEAVLPALQRTPCGVAFSGGRDSSLVIAVAMHLARREGLPEPVAVTLVFPDDESAGEHEWQERVVRHLGVTDWVRVAIRDELDLVGPLAQRHLLQRGVLWPPPIAADAPLVEVVRGGALLDGEGGDEVVGDGEHRIAPVAWLLRHPRLLRRRSLRAALRPLAPARLRLGRAHFEWETTETPWLRPAGRALLADRLAEIEHRRHLSFARSVRQVPIERHHVLAGRNRGVLADGMGVVLWSPLIDPQVVHGLARAGGSLGSGDRTAVLRSIAADLLPDDVLDRRTKATFNQSYFGRRTRDFASRWTGRGLDGTLVDVDALRSAWLGSEPHRLTAGLLQQAWLADHHRR